MAMSNLENFKNTRTLSDLAILLGYKPSSLAYIVYKVPEADKYTIFNVQKKRGGVRVIKAPVDRLKRLQRNLAKLLMCCEVEIHETLKHKKVLTHGFKKKYSILTNASVHKNKRHVFNVDLKDFFPSINFGRVRGFFIKNSHFELNEEVATLIAQIACHDNSLPQGSPCSPVISNLIGGLLDVRMVNLAKRAKCSYSRYVDDLTFSTNKKVFPSLLAIHSQKGIALRATSPPSLTGLGILRNLFLYIKSKIKNEKSSIEKSHDNVWIASPKLESEIDKVGFSINKKKLSMQFQSSRQVATGLVVNNKVNVRKEYYKKARSMCHTLFKDDTFYIDVIDPTTGASRREVGRLRQLDGHLSFVYQVRLYNEIRKDEQQKKKNYVKNFNEFNHTSAIARLYKDFLYYKLFFALALPLIVCEGKTDNVYLRCALKSLSSAYPSLIAKRSTDYQFKIKILNKSKNFLNVCTMGDGESGLATLIDSYDAQFSKYSGVGKKYPVIILVDDDKGAKKIKEKITKKFKKVELFQCYTENLYIVFIPSTGSTDTAIEDLFDKKVLGTVISGKKFNRNEKIDYKTEYSKQVFSKRVIMDNQKTIDFSNFSGVFDLFVQVVSDHAKCV